jgi:hypothetical protein
MAVENSVSIILLSSWRQFWVAFGFWSLCGAIYESQNPSLKLRIYKLGLIFDRCWCFFSLVSHFGANCISKQQKQEFVLWYNPDVIRHTAKISDHPQQGLDPLNET